MTFPFIFKWVAGLAIVNIFIAQFLDQTFQLDVVIGGKAEEWSFLRITMLWSKHARYGLIIHKIMLGSRRI